MLYLEGIRYLDYVDVGVPDRHHLFRLKEQIISRAVHYPSTHPNSEGMGAQSKLIFWTKHAIWFRYLESTYLCHYLTYERHLCLRIFAEAASCEIVKFLEIETTEDSSNGWMLLSTINLLSTGHSSLIDCMTAASLPSTLVKCLYLFFDLPDVENADRLEPGCEFSPRERRILLQKVFVQVTCCITK